MNTVYKALMFLFLLFGAWMVLVGVAYHELGSAPRFPVPGGKELASFTLSIIPAGMRNALLIDQYGLTAVLGGFGGVVTLLSLIILGNLRNSINPLTEFSEGMEEPTASDLHEELRIGEMVNMFQGTISKPDATKLIRDVRPDLHPHLQSLSDEAVVELARCILENSILRYRRKSKGISPDQYQVLDKNIVEVEKKSFGYRYMPDPNDISTNEMRQAVGKVYDRIAQSKVQKEFQSDAKDWVGLNLTNAVDVLTRDASKGRGFGIV